MPPVAQPRCCAHCGATAGQHQASTRPLRLRRSHAHSKPPPQTPQPAAEPATAPAPLCRALSDPSVANISLLGRVALEPEHWRAVMPVLVAREVELQGCPLPHQPQQAAQLHLNWLQRVLAVAPGAVLHLAGSLLLAGLAVPDEPLAGGWPAGLAPLLAAVDVQQGGGVALHNVSLVADLRPLQAALQALPQALQPHVLPAPTGLTITAWTITTADWAQQRSAGPSSSSSSSSSSSGVELAPARFALSNVQLMQQPPQQPCFPDFTDVQVGSSGGLYDALQDPAVSHIQLMTDVTLSAAHFAVSGLALPVERDVEVRACHPSGGRYKLNLGCIAAALLVARHRLRLSGDLLLLEVGPLGQQVFPGLGAIAVEGTGGVDLADVMVAAPTCDWAPRLEQVQCQPPADAASDGSDQQGQQRERGVPWTWLQKGGAMRLLHYAMDNAAYVGALRQAGAAPAAVQAAPGGYWSYANVTFMCEGDGMGAAGSSSSSGRQHVLFYTLLPVLLVLLAATVVGAEVMRRRGMLRCGPCAGGSGVTTAAAAKAAGAGGGKGKAGAEVMLLVQGDVEEGQRGRAGPGCRLCSGSGCCCGMCAPGTGATAGDAQRAGSGWQQGTTLSESMPT
jgi:hypothetical protein